MNLDKNNLQIITNPKEWNSLLQEIGDYDFYHTYDYHIIEMLPDHVPTLLKYTEKDCIIALPLLIRKINNTDYFDATSVYGYAGPISKGLNSEFSNELFIKKLLNFFQEKNIISVFSRLNPYINYQQEILKNFGDTVNQGKVVNIDLSLNITIQRQKYQNRLKTHINKSRRNCIIKKADSTKEIKDFIEIYYENMNRVKAEKHYYFNQNYFDKILTSESFKTELLLAYDKKTGTTIAGSLFVTTNNIVQYHLGGTKNEFLHLMPAKLLIDEMRIIATKRGQQFFNLGGGLGGDNNNYLFQFKSSFSKDFKDFKLWEIIINQKAYDNLVEKRKITDTPFFPKYRFLDKTQQLQIKQNPFTSTTFSLKWLNHFNQNRPVYNFDFITGLSFFKSAFLPIFINTGRNLTKGISYSLNAEEKIKFKKSVILIYDIPAYFNVETHSIPEKVKFHKIKQYPGYLVELNKFKVLNDYLQNTFRKKTNYNLNRCQKRLELCFNIKYKMFYGDISTAEYNYIFDCFKTLLEKRFSDKQTSNNNLNPEEWQFYHDLALPMILEKKASLFVVYENTNPIAISLNYLSEKILFYAIPVFDIDYSKFDLGKIAMLNLFTWCFENDIQYFDLSKGHFVYKTHWMTKTYNFEYHVYYDTDSIKSKFIAYSIKGYFELKQYLRDKELNEKLLQLTFWFKKSDVEPKTSSSFSLSEITKEYEDDELLKIDLLNKDHITLKPVINEFLFLNKESLYDLKIMKVISNQSTYIFKGKQVSKKIVIN